MPNDVWMDFESYSEVDLLKAGGYAYATHDSTNPICLGWAINDGPANLWTPAEDDPIELLDNIADGARIYAHSLTFDFRIWNIIMSRDFSWPMIDLDNCVDTKALCATYGLPLNLAAAGTAMNLTMQKEAVGKALIKLLSKPNKKGGQPLQHDPKYQAKFREMFAYCKRDIEAMRELVKTKLPRDFLIPQEHEIWKLTCHMNANGLPIAYNEVVAIRDYLNKYIETEMVRVPILTGGAIDKITQTVKIAEWCTAQGYPMDSVAAAVVDEALEDPRCTGKVRRLLELRQELGKSSVAKFTKLMQQAVPDENGQYWIYDNLEFHGAGPGRWTGRGFQMHNLPRFKHDQPEEIIQEFLDGGVIEDPVGKAKGLIRPMIKAPKGWVIYVLDYNSIENKLLHWIADDQVTLDDFRNNIDQYITMAAARYKVEYDQVTKPQRFMGKVIILGCGFGMGKDTFIVTAKTQFSMIIEEEEAAAAIFAYREKYFLVKKLWNDLKNAAVQTVMTGKKHTVRLITFGLSVVKGATWLAMRLPSGKCVYYRNPKIEARFIPKYEDMGRVPTITHEGRHPKTGKWCRMPLIPGRITENAVQGTAREAMAQGLLNVKNRMPQVKLIGTVHDEGLALVREEDNTPELFEEYNRNLCDIPWAKDCPITASGYIAKRYKKD